MPDSERDSLFDDANGALALGELEEACALYRRCVAIDPEFFDGWHDAQMAKITSSLDRFEQWSAGFGDRIDVGTISIGCALSYLDFRYPKLDWRGARPGIAAWYAVIAQRPSFAATGLHVS